MLLHAVFGGQIESVCFVDGGTVLVDFEAAFIVVAEV